MDYSSNTTSLTIGRGQTYNLHFNGAIDDVSIYHRALSDSEISALYSAGGWPSSGAGTVSITPSSTQRICAGDSVRLTANETGPTASYRWTPATGLSDPTSRTPMARPLVTTTYQVETFTSEPCSERLASASVTIEVDPAPRMNLGADTRYVCVGDTITIGGTVRTGLAPYRYSWAPSTGLSSTTDPQPRVVVSKSERYIVTTTDARGCVGRDTVQVTAIVPPSPDAGGDSLFCGGAPIVLGRADSLNGGNPPRRYRWWPRAGLDDTTLAQPSASPVKTTRYYVEITDALGCPGIDSVLVTVEPAASAITGSDTAICVGGEARLGAASVAGYRYAWSPAAGLSDAAIADPIARPASTTTYHLLATTAAGCTATDSVMVTVLDPILEVSPAALDFGTLDGCTSSKELTVRVSNSGTSALTITTTTFSTQDFIAVTGLPLDIAAGASRDVIVRYAPRGAGVATDTLVIAGEPCGVVARIPLTGARERSLLSTSTATIDFGRALACALPDSTIELAITNDGGAEASLGAAIIAAPFAIEPGGALPATLSAGGTLTLRVRYRPAGAGVHGDELRLPFTSGTCRDTLRVQLSGVVDAPIVAALDAIDIGTLDGCATTRDTTIVLRNRGTAVLRLTTATPPVGYRMMTPAPLDIAVDDSAALVVRYEPSGNGAHAGDLVLAFEPCALIHRVALSGSKEGASFALVDSIDVGSVVDCDPATATKRATIGYEGVSGSQATVARVSVTGPFTTTLQEGTNIADGASATFDVSVMPGPDGLVTGALEIILEPCGVMRRIALRAERTSMSIAAADLDFGTRATASVSTLDAIVVNSGSAATTIDSVGNVAAPFVVTGTTPALPATLAPGESLAVHVEYRAVTGPSVDTIRAFASTPCDAITSLVLRGTGASTAAATIALPRITAAAGDNVMLALVLDSAAGLDAASATQFEAVLAFDRSMLVPVDKAGVTADATTRRMTISGTRGASDTLAALAMIATLGRAETTPLRIESFRWIDAMQPVATDLVDGELRISGICESRGARLFDGDGEVTLKPASPNPASGTAAIEYGLAEPGRTRLLLYDASGRHVATLVDGDLDAGAYVQWVDVSTIPSGSYVVVLVTPTLVVSERLEVR